MTVTLYNNKSAYNTLHKDMTTVATVSNVLIKGQCSIDKPSLLITYTAMNFNYFYVDTFSRFYQVTNRQLIEGERMILTGQCDPVQSFAAGIADLEVLITRAEDTSIRSPELVDNLIPMPSKNEYLTRSTQQIVGTGEGNYVIGVI